MQFFLFVSTINIFTWKIPQRGQIPGNDSQVLSDLYKDIALYIEGLHYNRSILCQDKWQLPKSWPLLPPVFRPNHSNLIIARILFSQLRLISYYLEISFTWQHANLQTKILIVTKLISHETFSDAMASHESLQLKQSLRCFEVLNKKGANKGVLLTFDW